MLEGATGGGDDDVGVLAHLRRLDLEVLAAGDQFSLDKGEFGKVLHLAEDLPGQLAGRQQDQRPRRHGLTVVGHQSLQHGQYKGRRLAAAGLGNHMQIVPRDCWRDGCLLNLGGGVK